MTVLLCGTSGCGKSTLASLLVKSHSSVYCPLLLSSHCVLPMFSASTSSCSMSLKFLPITGIVYTSNLLEGCEEHGPFKENDLHCTCQGMTIWTD